MRHTYFLLLGLLVAAPTLAQTDRVGVGTTTPRAGLDVQHNDGLLATGTFNQGNTDNLPTGAGTRLMWIPKKAAFRAGHAAYDEWDYANIGNYSTALGFYTVASGEASTALGRYTTAGGTSSTALGRYAVASGDYSTALGDGNLASGDYATAMGYLTIADGINSTALGNETTADGNYSTAMGNYASTNGKTGSFIVADISSVQGRSITLTSDHDNQFKARFVGGYRLVTDEYGGVFAELKGGQTAWSTSSDSTRKAGFRPADGALFLQKIAVMRLGSWHYKGQDARTQRHYGPMAQDFFAAFGRDGVGTVGEETTINQADFDGVNLIAIQALVRENEALKTRLERLEAEKADLHHLVDQLAADVQNLKTTASR